MGEILANNDKKEYIICAAIYFNDGKQYVHQPKNITEGFVICGRRHHNCFMSNKILELCENKKCEHIQGFLTSKDIFVDRAVGGKIAFEANQIDEETTCLFSEDLY